MPFSELFGKKSSFQNVAKELTHFTENNQRDFLLRAQVLDCYNDLSYSLSRYLSEPY